MFELPSGGYRLAGVSSPALDGINKQYVAQIDSSGNLAGGSFIVDISDIIVSVSTIVATQLVTPVVNRVSPSLYNVSQAITSTNLSLYVGVEVSDGSNCDPNRLTWSTWPTASPSVPPTSRPSSFIPSPVPTIAPSLIPSPPSCNPTNGPSFQLGSPTPAPSEVPSVGPTPRHTVAVSLTPSTVSPSRLPSHAPVLTFAPSTRRPTIHITYNPSILVTSHPTTFPSSSQMPSADTSELPSTSPTSLVREHTSGFTSVANALAVCVLIVSIMGGTMVYLQLSTEGVVFNIISARHPTAEENAMIATSRLVLFEKHRDGFVMHYRIPFIPKNCATDIIDLGDIDKLKMALSFSGEVESVFDDNAIMQQAMKSVYFSNKQVFSQLIGFGGNNMKKLEAKKSYQHSATKTIF